ncbi:MAG: lasso peptide biosynthesis protein [Oscillospiraceae bacterium]|nr:lasso peptide biosynthesis protein [Oscillospiraceae bacterium]
MKLEKGLSCLTGTVLAFGIAFGIAFGGVGCMITAFHLTSADLTEVGLLCALCAAAACLCFSFRRGGLVLLAALALLAGYLVREGTVERELEALLYQISKFYDGGYGWGTIGWSGVRLDGYDVTGGLVLAAAAVAIAVSWVVCRRKWVVLGVIVGFVPLAACCVVTDTIPDEGYLFLMLAGQALLLLTQGVRRRSAADGVRLTALLMVPVLLASALLFTLMPRDGYEIRADSIQQTVLSWFRQLPFVVQDPEGGLTVSIGGTAVTRVNLAAVGPKAKMRYAVMDVVADSSEILYLRGQSFDVYDGMSWAASEESSGEDRYWPDGNMVRGGEVSITTRAVQSVLYAPYYPAGGEWRNSLEAGMLKNTERVRTYSFIWQYPNEASAYMIRWPETDALLERCLELPDSTREAAEEILAQLLTAPSRSYTYAEMAGIIGNFVRASAEYSLDTSRMPGDETDFALWFLKESDTGYCVHFATATAVLLRAAGVPARYVTGYMAEVQGGTRTSVTADKAHAWVEYLDPTLGWTILDATPEDPEAEETEPVETTEPVQVTKPTIATEPEETTEPSETAEPTDSTEQSETFTDPTEGQGGTGGTGTGGGQTPEWLRKLLTAVGCVLGAAAVLAGQYGIRRRLRSKRMRTGPNNKRAVHRWRHVCRMAKLTGKKPPERLEELAEKAVFSQHTLTVSELMEFDAWLEEAGQALDDKPWIQRILIRLIWAVE